MDVSKKHIKKNPTAYIYLHNKAMREEKFWVPETLPNSFLMKWYSFNIPFISLKYLKLENTYFFFVLYTYIFSHMNFPDFNGFLSRPILISQV